MSAADASLTRTPRFGAASLRLLRSELHIIMGRRRNQAGLLVLAAMPILIAVAVKLSQPTGRGGGGDFITAITSNGMFVALAALNIELALFLPLAVSMLCGDTIAGEANIGTLRYLLTVPVHRTRLLAVKYVSLVIGAFIGVLVVVVAGLIIGGILFGLGPVTLLSGTQVPLVDALGRLALAVLYLSACLSALATIGLFISTLTEQPIGAMIATVIVSTAMWILDGISQLDWLHPWLLVDHWMAFADFFRDPVYTEGVQQGLLLSLGYIVVFLGLAWARFAQKDITS